MQNVFNFYKKMIRLRQSNSALANGSYQTLSNDNDKVFSFLRKEKNTVCIVVNLSDQAQQVAINLSGNSRKAKALVPLWGKEKARLTDGQGKRSGSNLSVSLPAYSVQIWEIR